MKKLLCLLPVVMMLFFVAACGTDQTVKVPGEDLIRTDLQNALSEYQSRQDACALTVQDYQTTQSLTEDTSYTAQVMVTAQSQYARFHYTASIAYTLYDQGWIMDFCEWSDTGYEVVRYPDGEDLENVEDRYRVQEMKDPVFSGEENILTVTSRIEGDWSAYVTGGTEYAASWEYNPHSDRWDYQDTTNHTEITLTDAFADTVAEIFECSNFTENSFVIASDNEYFHVAPTRVKLSEYSSYFDEDAALLAFNSDYDIGFENKADRNDGIGYMRVGVVIYKEPQSQDGHHYDILVVITMTDEYWSTKPQYEIVGYHDLP